MILCISVLSVVISPFSFLILLIWFFFLFFFFLMSLANGLSVLFIFSKNQLLVFLILAIVSFVSFSFISALIFMIYFFILTPRFFISSISSYLRCSVQFSSVAQSCPTLCYPMKDSMPGLPVHHQLPKSTQTHVHWVGDAIQPSHPVIPVSSCPQSFPALGSFQMSQLFKLGGQSIGISASASVLPMNTQDWSPSEWTGWISLQSKGLSRVFSNTTVQKHQFFGPQLSSQSNSHIHTWPLEKP